MSIRNNISLTQIKALSRFLLVQQAREQALIDEYIRALEIKTKNELRCQNQKNADFRQLYLFTVHLPIPPSIKI